MDAEMVVGCLDLRVGNCEAYLATRYMFILATASSIKLSNCTEHLCNILQFQKHLSVDHFTCSEIHINSLREFFMT